MLEWLEIMVRRDIWGVVIAFDESLQLYISGVLEFLVDRVDLIVTGVLHQVLVGLCHMDIWSILRSMRSNYTL